MGWHLELLLRTILEQSFLNIVMPLPSTDPRQENHDYKSHMELQSAGADESTGLETAL